MTRPCLRLWLSLGLVALSIQPARAATERLAVRVLRELPHDPTAFTQGLEMDGGTLLESTGLYGRSSLRRVELATGRVLARRDLPEDLFGEGLTRVGREVVQLTWLAGLALRVDAESFEPLRRERYEGEGWGLCFDGARLVMSDGSAVLSFRSPSDFHHLGGVTVRLEGKATPELNELECVGRSVFANVLGWDQILRIDPATGTVTGIVDAGALRARLPAGSRKRADVLNGIAHDPDSGHFFLTGKLWPTLFEVRFVAAESEPPGAPVGRAERAGPERIVARSGRR